MLLVMHMINAKQVEQLISDYDIRKCPFCGGDAHIRAYLPAKPLDNEDLIFIEVGCDKCEIGFSTVVSLSIDTSEIVKYRCDTIVKKWNTRRNNCEC